MDALMNISEFPLDEITLYTSEIAGYFQQNWLVAAVVVTVTMAFFTMLSARASRTKVQWLNEEIGRLHVGLLSLERLYVRSERQIVLLEDGLQRITQKQQKLSLRESKVDYKLAAAMARAGAGSKQIVECGLSHGEAHLIEALHGRNRVLPSDEPSDRNVQDQAA